MSKGKPKPKLRDLSRAKPTTEDLAAWRSSFDDIHPIATAVWGAAMVEHELEELLQSRFKKVDSQTWAKMLENNGPISSFSSKIILGFALNIYDSATRDNLNIVREIRNTFAHSKLALEFDHPLIIAELRQIKIPKGLGMKRGMTALKSLRADGKYTYIGLCYIINEQLMKTQIRSMKAKTKRLQLLANNRKRGWGSWEDLMKSPPTNALESNWQSFQQRQSGGPNPPVEGGLLGGLLPYFEAKKDKTDKK